MSNGDSNNQREQLLRRWAEVAPRECRLARGMVSREPRPYAVSYKEQWLRVDLYHSPEALLLVALIEAIRARGWDARMDIDAALCQAFAVPDSPVNEQFGASKEPCDALLAAYVAALEATKEPQP